MWSCQLLCSDDMDCPILLYVTAHALHSEMQEIKYQFVDVDKAEKRLPKEISMKEASLKFMEQRNRIMKEINGEKKHKLQEERRVLVLTEHGFYVFWPNNCGCESDCQYSYV